MLRVEGLWERFKMLGKKLNLGEPKEVTLGKG